MSALLSEGDLNDFISPGLACIKPAGEVRASQVKETEIQIGSNGEVMEVSIDDGSVSNLPSAFISLQDCLACSGCVTSAEEVLLTKQTHKVFLEDLKKYKNEKIFCVSISHQTRVSLSDFLKLNINKVDQFLINFFSEKFGFKFIVGTELGRIISIQKQNEEILRLKETEGSKPYLSAICPGFVLYVEKTKSEILPYLLNVKSPQQITGLLLKSFIAKQMNIKRTNIYHLSIMPCFDKKLEASRPEVESTDSEPDLDVDCVLTPKELIEMLKELPELNIFDFITKDEKPSAELYQRAAPQNWPNPIESWSSNLGSTSGGYALNYILYLKQYYSSQYPDCEIKEIKGKNSDVYEYQLWNNETKLGSSAVINGFRNIQNLVRKLKPNGKVKIGSGLQTRRKVRTLVNKTNSNSCEPIADPTKCDFVEVMACPGGCINGGGIIQTQVQDTTIIHESNQQLTEKEHLNKLTVKYDEFQKIDVLKSSELLRQFIEEFKSLFNITEERLLRYKFNKIEKAVDVLSVGSKW